MSFLSAMRSIQNDALAKGGSYVHYSQCLEPTNTLINMLPYTSGGICSALSAKWIAEHANGGSLWNWLFTPGTTNVKQSAITTLMINFIDSTVRTAGSIDHSVGNRGVRSRIASRLSNRSARSKNTGNFDYQDFVIDKYLGLYGLKRRNIVQDGVIGSIKNQLSVGGGINAGRRLGRRLNEKQLVSKGSGSYVMINIMGNGGHAMAAYVGSDVAFFDPNFGEFWFPSQKKFYEFFLNFWRTSGYESEFSSYFLQPYAKGI